MEGESRDEVYYVVRIIPPVVGVVLLVLLVLLIAYCTVHLRGVSKRKKGEYEFSELDHEYHMQ